MLRNYKKCVSFVLVLAISIMISVPAFANTGSSITDKQIDDIVKTGEVVDSSNQYIVFSKTETVSTGANSILSSESKNNVINKVQTNVELVSVDGNIQKLLNTISSNGGSVERSKSDGSYSATISTRVYYSEYDNNGKQYYGVDSVDGNIEGGGSGYNLGSNVKIVKNYATIGQEGYVPSGTYHSSRYTYNLSTGKRSWTYTTPSSWSSYPVADSSSNHAGANYFVTLQRGSSSWDISLSNDIFGRNSY